jgi:hypothetical protein
MEKYSWEGQRALAEEMVAPWRYVLQKIGIRVAVDVYTGSLSSMVENYRRGDGISLVMRKLAAKVWASRFREVPAATIMRTTSSSEQIKRRSTAPTTSPTGTESK